MKITRAFGLISGAAVLLWALAGDASAAKLVYRTKVVCDGSGHGVALVQTLVLRGGGIVEPFFRVTARLSHLPDLPVTTCQASLECEGLPDVTVDCAAAVDGDELSFVSQPIFMGLITPLCRRPAVRVDLTYPGTSQTCLSGF